jgi:hypothetical protein
VYRVQQKVDKQKQQLRGLSPWTNYTNRATPLVGEVSTNFCR